MDAWMSIQQFSERFGFSTSTIRRRIREGNLTSWQPGGPRTRLLVRFPDIVASPRETVEQIPGDSRPRSSDDHKLSGPPPKWRTRR